MFPGSEMTLTRTSIRFINANLAVWDGTFEITGLPEAEGEQPPSKGLSMVVAQKQDGQWLLAAGRTFVPVQLPPAGQ